MLNLVFGAGGASSVPVTNLHIELRASRQLKKIAILAEPRAFEFQKLVQFKIHLY